MAVCQPCHESRSNGGFPEKKSLHASEEDTAHVQQARADDQEFIAALDVRRLQFIDESGVNLAMPRLYGRAPKGEWGIAAVPQNYRQHVTMLGALSIEGIEAVLTVEGATEADVFLASVAPVLALPLRPGEMVVMDHRRAHKVAGVPQAIAGCGARLLYWPL